MTNLFQVALPRNMVVDRINQWISMIDRMFELDMLKMNSTEIMEELIRSLFNCNETIFLYKNKETRILRSQQSFFISGIRILNNRCNSFGGI